MAPSNRVTRFLFKNLLLGLLSLILGFLAWLYLANKVEGVKKIPMVLEYRIPPDRNYASQPAIKEIKDGALGPIEQIEVEVEIRGLKDKINTLDPNSIKLQLTVDREEYPTFTVDTDLLMGLDTSLTARILNPQTYQINFAKQFAVPATLKLEYNREDFELGGKFYEDWLDPSYELNPARVTVTGRLDKLQVAPDQQVFLYTKKLELTPDDLKSGAWKRNGKLELSNRAEIVDSQGNHDWVTVDPDVREISFDATVATRPQTGAVKIPLQVLPPIDRLKLGTTDAFDTYILAENAPREVTVQYSKPRENTAIMDSTKIFAFVNVTTPGNLANLPISIYTVHNDPRIKIWLAAGPDDNNALHANVKVIQADIGATLRAQGPFPIHAVFGQSADRRYQITVAPLALDNLLAHGSNRSLGATPIGADEITLMVEIPHSAFTGREFEQDLPLLVIKPDRVTTLTTADNKPLPPVRVRIVPPVQVPDSKPQLIGDVPVEVEYPQNFQLRVQLIQTKVAVSAAGAKEIIDALRPDMLIAIARPSSDDDRADFTGKARIVGVFRKVMDNGKITGLEPVPNVLFFPADKVEFKTSKAVNPDSTQGPDSMFEPVPVPTPPPAGGRKLPPPPPYGS